MHGADERAAPAADHAEPQRARRARVRSRVDHADPLVIEIDILEIVELLQHEMAGIVEDIATLVTADAIEKHLERHAVMQILAGMDFVTQVDARLLERVENR